MSYIGKTPTVGNFQVCDAISVVNNQAAYTMQVGSVNVSPESANHMIVSLNGVIQKPTDAFTVSGSVITFASNLVTGDVINFIQILGNVLDLGVPSDSTVSIAKLTATGTKNSTTFLRGDNTFNAPPLGGITMADQWRLSANQELTTADVTANLEQVDTAGQGTIGTAMSQSSGIFTFPLTGIYMVRFDANFRQNSGAGGARYIIGKIKVTTNNSSYVDAAIGFTSMDDWINNTISVSTSTASLIDVTNTSNVKVKFSTESATSSNFFLLGDSTKNISTFSFTRLGDT